MEIKVKTSTSEYPIYIERGCLANIAKYVDVDRKTLIITESNIPISLVDKIKNQLSNVYTICLDQGEGSKSLEVYSKCIDTLLNNNFNRNDMIIALGGGVIGDLSGYVASTYLRGIDFLNIPTSTLAQIDSSIGGKVAINHQGIKNCIGSFYPPLKVLIDFDVLASLDKRNVNNGLIEALKAGLIGDAKIYEYFKNNDIDNNIEDIIVRSLLVKKKLVEEDEFERGNRKLLNLGHTLGHAIESSGNLTTYLHGEAVGLGLIAMIDNAILKEEIRLILKRLEIPDLNINKEEIKSYLKNDKKSNSKGITTIRVKDIGQCYLKEETNDRCLELLEETYG